MATKKTKSKSASNNVKSEEIPKTITFNYIKGPDFRSVHIDGAIGGITTKGFLHIALFAERTVIPQETTFKLNPDRMLGDEIVEKRVSKEGIVRQMEADIIVNEQTAIDLRNWLNDRLAELESRKKIVQKTKISSNKKEVH